MAGAFERKGASILVGGDSAGDQREAAVAADSAGGYRVIWTEQGGTAPDGSGSSIRSQGYDSAGSLVGQETQVNSIVSGDQNSASIGAVASGNGYAAFVTAWADTSGSDEDPSSGIRVKRLTAVGSDYGWEFHGNTRNTAGDQVAPVVGTNPLLGEHYLVAWTDKTTNSIKGQLFDEGRPTGSTLGFGTVDLTVASDPVIVANSYDGFLVGWTAREKVESARSTLYGGFVSYYGYIEYFVISDDAPGVRTGLSLARLVDGRIVASWTGIDANGDAGVVARLFEADGTAVGAEFAVNTHIAGAQVDSQVVALADGGFAVVWTDENGIGRDVMTQLFDTAGHRFGVETRVNDSAAGDQWNAALATLTDGSTAVTWTEQSTGGTQDVRAQRIQFASRPTPVGTAGDDTLDGTARDETINGLAGADVIHGYSGNDVLDGGAGNDRLFGGQGDDRLIGGLDDDYLEDTTVGIDRLDGGDGSDTIVVRRSNDPAHDKVTVIGGAGADLIDIRALGSDITIDAGSGNDTVRLALQDVDGTLTLGTGIDRIEFVDSLPDFFRKPTLLVTDFQTGAKGDVVDVSAVAGTDPFRSGTLYLEQNGTAVDLRIANSNDVILASFANHKVADFTSYNFAGASLATTTVVSASGTTTNSGRLVGLPAIRIAGADVRFVNEAGGEIVKREEGAADPTAAAVVITGRGATVENASGATISADSGSFQAILGSAFADTVINNGTIFGRVALAGGDDSYYELFGESENYGSRIVDLGDGDDTATLDSARSSYRENVDVIGGAGVDRVVLTNIGAEGRIRLNTFSGVEELEMVGLGDGSRLTLTRNAPFGGANLSISGGLTLDLPDNVFGEDSYTGPATGIVRLNGGAINFGINTSFAQILGGNLADRVIMDARLFEPAQEATPVGSIDLGDGDDLLDWRFPHPSPGEAKGGAGRDTLRAGQYHETQSLAAFSGFEVIDYYLVNGGSGLTYRLSGVATDAQQLLLEDRASPSTVELDLGSLPGLTLGVGGTHIVLLAGSEVAGITDRSNLDQTTVASANLVDVLGRVTGAVSLGGGDDRLVVGGRIDGAMDGGAGLDAIDWSAITGTGMSFDLARGTVSAGGVVRTMTGFEQLTGTGAADTIVGAATASTMFGGGGNDRITGGAGHDVLDGGAGADRMTGGTGNDAYYVDNAGDVVVEAANGGSDRVFSSLSYTLGANLEKLTLIGTGDTTGRGNSYNNDIKGNGGHNVLDGGTGADTMSGGKGNDAYYVDNVGDVVTELANEGSDRVFSSIGYTLGANLEKLTLTGTASVDGRGNSYNNDLKGNAGNNVLNGGTGSDTLTGGAGADHFLFDTKLGSSNVDRILDFSVKDDTIDLDRSAFNALPEPGTLAADAFWQGTAAHDATDRIVYDQASGHLFYDADGAGGAAAILFASVTPGTALTAADFLVVP